MGQKAYHWADQTAQRVVGQRRGQDEFVVASGITPSGVVHIGNFREVITVDLVARALRSLGKKVKFIYSWDNFDTFRKVPVDLPNQELMKENMWRSIARIPDAYECHDNYAAHNIARFEGELGEMGIKPEFQYQEERYSKGMYAEGMLQALQQKDKIVAILNEYRSSPLADSWLPTSIYCEKCGRDKMQEESFKEETYHYTCDSCGHAGAVNIRETRDLKLGWRVDWPMRWAFYGVDFEPGGKDHSSDGGSYDTAKKIVKAVWDKEPPVYQQYDFVSIKGGPGKISSSAGGAVALSQVLEVYAPEMIRFIFARQKPNSDFSIAFDEDVIKIHDEFDRCEKSALEPAGENPNQKWLSNRRIYEMSLVEEGNVPSSAPFRAPFRVLANRLQICDGDVERCLSRYYQAEVLTEEDRASFVSRAQRAWVWISRYAPEEFRYRLHESKVQVDMDDGQQQAMGHLVKLIEATDLDAIAAPDLNQKIYDDVIRPSGCDGKQFFQAVYRSLIGRDQGPRLPGFMKEIGKDKLLSLLA